LVLLFLVILNRLLRGLPHAARIFISIKWIIFCVTVVWVSTLVAYAYVTGH